MVIIRKSDRILIFLTLLIIVGIVVWWLVTPPIKPPSGSFSQLNPVDWQLSTNGSLLIIVQNNFGTNIDLNPSEITANLVDGSSGNGRCELDLDSIPTNRLKPRETTKIIKFNCPIAPNIKAGDYYRINLSLGFTDPAYKMSHKSIGLIWGPFN